MGKLLPTPYPGESMDNYRERLVNFQTNYFSFLKPSKGGSKFIPLPPEHLKPKEMRPNIIPAIAASNKRKNETKKMSVRKLNEHVEEELFNKEKRTKTSEPKVVNEGDAPVKKKKPYYRKKYTKKTPTQDAPIKKYKNIEVEPFKFLNPPKNYLFIKGLLVGSVITAIICHIIYSI